MGDLPHPHPTFHMVREWGEPWNGCLLNCPPNPPRKNLRCFLLSTKSVVLDLVRNLCVTFNTLFNLAAITLPAHSSAQIPCSYNLSFPKQVISFQTSAFVSISHLLECFLISPKYLILPSRPSFNVCSMVSLLLHDTVIMWMHNYLSHQPGALFLPLLYYTPGCSGGCPGYRDKRMESTKATNFFLGGETFLILKQTWIHYRTKCMKFKLKQNHSNKYGEKYWQDLPLHLTSVSLAIRTLRRKVWETLLALV